MATSPHDESRLAAVTAALSPYPWRSFTPELLARWVLAASDRHGIAHLLGAVPGADVGSWAQAEPAVRDDVRVDALVVFLAAHCWTELRLVALCRHLLAVQHDGC